MFSKFLHTKIKIGIHDDAQHDMSLALSQKELHISDIIAQKQEHK